MNTHSYSSFSSTLLLEQLELGLSQSESRCLVCACNDKNNGCDFTCTAQPDVYVQRVREVEGLNGHVWPRLLPTDELKYPPHIPVLHPRRFYPDLSHLDFVAVKLYELFSLSKDQSTYIPKYSSGKELRSKMKCSPDCRILLSGVDCDRQLELFWRFLESNNLASTLARLNVDAVTLPNFSFFTPMPDEHSLYNIRRMQIVAARLTEVGVRVIPHMNATTAEHWRMWTELLAAQPQIMYVCKEFETGNRLRTNAEDAVTQLLRLQAHIGRRLSIILIAGQQHLDLFRQRFRNVTVVDSQVTMKSAHYQRGILQQNGTVQWHQFSAPRGESMVRLFRENLAVYTASIVQALSSEPIPMQMQLNGILHEGSPARRQHAA